jgi:hypothetical protein
MTGPLAILGVSIIASASRPSPVCSASSKPFDALREGYGGLTLRRFAHGRWRGDGPISAAMYEWAYIVLMLALSAVASTTMIWWGYLH